MTAPVPILPPIDRTGWRPGPWDGEPDREVWQVGDVTCAVLRAPAGHLLGYAIVGPGHPWYALHWYALPDCAAEWCEHRDGWTWYGFDCAHSWHRSPTRDSDTGEYVTMRAAIRMVESIVEAMRKPPTPEQVAASEDRIRFEMRLWSGEGDYSVAQRQRAEAHLAALRSRGGAP